MATVRAAHPTVPIWMTECSGGGWATNYGDNLMWNVRNLLVDSMQAWSSSVILWNLALDEHGNPHTGGCSNCRGVVTVDSATAQVRPEVELDVLAHYGIVVRPGARRIAATGSLSSSALAFSNPDGSSAVILLNESSSARAVTVAIGGGEQVALNLPGRSVTTLHVPSPG
jgi:glucosylceramidase